MNILDKLNLEIFDTNLYKLTILMGIFWIIMIFSGNIYNNYKKKNKKTYISKYIYYFSSMATTIIVYVIIGLLFINSLDNLKNVYEVMTAIERGVNTVVKGVDDFVNGIIKFFS